MAPGYSDSLIADAHNDLLLEVAWREEQGEANPFREHWLEPLVTGGVDLQVCPIFVDLEYLPEGALRVALKQAAAFHRLVQANTEVRAVLGAADLDAPGLGLMLSMEGAEPFGSSPELVDAFWALGVRMVSLTWNRRNVFADGAAESGGLSALGRELVARLVERGVVLDLVHASEPSYWEALEVAGDSAVVCVSHACCRAVNDTPRNLSDDQLRALAERGGVLGVMALPLAVDPARPTIERLVDHVDHAISVIGVEHVAVGADFIAQVFDSGATRVSPREQLLLPPGRQPGEPLEGLRGPAEYPRLVEALRARGYDGERLEAILRGNLVRLLRRALPP